MLAWPFDLNGSPINIQIGAEGGPLLGFVQHPDLESVTAEARQRLDRVVLALQKNQLPYRN